VNAQPLQRFATAKNIDLISETTVNGFGDAFPSDKHKAKDS